MSFLDTGKVLSLGVAGSDVGSGLGVLVGFSVFVGLGVLVSFGVLVGSGYWRFQMY
jgi:hypothetical protein